MLYVTLVFTPSKINKRYSAIYISKFDWKFHGKTGKSIYITCKILREISWHFVHWLILQIQASPYSFSVLPPTSYKAPLLSKGVKLWFSA